MENDIIMFDVLPHSNDEPFLFNHESDMVFTHNTLTFFELEYKRADNSCFHYPLNIWEKIEPVIYIYDQNNKYIALKIYANKFRISNGANAYYDSHSCSQSLASTGITLTGMLNILAQNTDLRCLKSL